MKRYLASFCIAIAAVAFGAAAHAEEKASGQESLFGGPQQSLPEPALGKAENWDPLERLRHEFDAVGFYLSAHPLDNMATQLERLRVVPSTQVEQALQVSATNRLRMAGIVVRKQERTSQKGNRFAFVQVSDPYGVFEMMVFSELLNASRELLEAGMPILLSVDVDKKNEEELRFLAQSIDPLTAAVQSVTRQVIVHVDRPEAVARIKAILAEAGQGRVRVQLVADAGKGRIAELDIPGGWNIREETPKALRMVQGVSDVREV